MPTRREFTTGLAGVAAQRRTPPPNILFVLSDDHTVPHLGCYGDPVIRTPHLDKLASQGLRFDQAFTAAPQCVPSRTAFLTGRSPVAARMGRFSSPLPPDVVTLPELLRTRGYFTGVCRRWFHLDGPARPGPVTGPIFDKYSMRTFEKRVDYLDGNSRREQTAEKVTGFFDKRPKDAPFFLWVNFNDPHHAWDRNNPFDKYDRARMPIPAHLPDLPGMREDLARYYGEISRADDEFHTVLDIVEARGGADNTIVVFAGDNGYAFPHGKGSLYDPGLNVPFLVRWPGVVKPGATTRELVSGEDLTPTLLDAAGITAPKEMSGRSFLPLLRGQPHTGREHIFAARLTHGSSPVAEGTKASTFDLSRCVRGSTHKLIYNCTPQYEYQPVDSARDAGWQEMIAAHAAGKLSPPHDRAYFGKRPVLELYDLAKDPAELDNAAGRPEYARVQRELLIAMQEKMIRDYDFLPLPLAE